MDRTYVEYLRRDQRRRGKDARVRMPAVVTRARPLLDGTRTMVRLLPTVSRGLTVAAYVLAVVCAAAPIAMLLVAGALVGRFVGAGDELPSGTVGLLVLLPVLLFLQEAARQALGVVTGVLGRRVDGALRDRVLGASLEPAGIAHLEDPELRALFGAARNLSPFFFTPGDAAQQLPWALTARVQGVLAVAVVLVLAPVAGVVAALVFLAAQVWSTGTIIALVTSSAFGMLTPDIVYLRELAMTAPPAKEVRVFGLGPWLDDRFGRLAGAKLDAALAARRGQLRSFARIGVLLGAGLAVTAVLVGWGAVRGDLSVGALVTVTLALVRVFSPPNTMPDISVVYGSLTIAGVDRAVEAAVPTVPRAERPTPVPAADRELVFEDVRFGYGDADVFSALDLTVPAGQQLAVVGLNGAGKTTLVKLLCRLYDPVAGAVRVDGVDLRELDPEAWRARLGVLFQDFIRWELPASDNVSLRRDPTGTSDRVVRAAERAGVDDLVASLPDGWETSLSPGAGGVDLSGGQWQRLALARALHAVEGGARILVFDEPTANLDALGEQRFFDDVLANPALRTAPDGSPVTTILISHRFATVRHADRIVVLGDGGVLEDGTHADLLAAGRSYAELFHAQAKAFDEVVG
jgi:ATP-binding cassette subfamily B protein